MQARGHRPGEGRREPRELWPGAFRLHRTLLPDPRDTGLGWPLQERTASGGWGSGRARALRAAPSGSSPVLRAPGPRRLPGPELRAELAPEPSQRARWLRCRETSPRGREAWRCGRCRGSGARGLGGSCAGSGPARGAPGPAPGPSGSQRPGARLRLPSPRRVRWPAAPRSPRSAPNFCRARRGAGNPGRGSSRAAAPPPSPPGPRPRPPARRARKAPAAPPTPGGFLQPPATSGRGARLPALVPAGLERAERGCSGAAGPREGRWPRCPGPRPGRRDGAAGRARAGGRRGAPRVSADAVPTPGRSGRGGPCGLRGVRGLLVPARHPQHRLGRLLLPPGRRGGTRHRERRERPRGRPGGGDPPARRLRQRRGAAEGAGAAGAERGGGAGDRPQRPGHVTITNYLLNYFPGLDLERRNVFGFTALMKAAMQGRTECIRALMLAGADVHARDPRRGMAPQEWAAYTGRLEAVRLIQRLLERPCPEQFGERYKPELPLPAEAVLKPSGSKSCLQRLAELVRATLTSRSRQGPEDGGVLDHMVRMTTSLYSPAVAIVCQTVCPEDAPCVGKRRLAVQEILEARGSRDTRAQEGDKIEGPEPPFRTSRAVGVSREGAPRAGLPSPQQPGAPRRASLLPLQLLRRSSVRPGVVIPRVRISKAPAPTFQPERAAARGSTKDSAHLQLPKWRYKEAKEEKRRAEEAEKQRAAAAQDKRAPSWRKRTMA
uniref:Ankyrin repeat domain 33B n=1 Tax=Canis lupus familiaris TaxID=9615 RepID=A0A8C0TFE5_CANLF